MRKCFLCDAVGIQTVANSQQPIVINDKQIHACTDCYNNHHRALERGLRTMFERLFPADFRKIKARADAKPRAVKQEVVEPVAPAVVDDPDPVNVPKPKLTIFPAD